jgi:hypothetical protein
MSIDTFGAASAWSLLAPQIVERWWVLALRGVAGILLGIAAFAWPGLTLVVLVILFGAYLLVDGVLALVAGGMARSWLIILEGAAGVIAGILALVWPGITAVVLLFLIAAWAIVTGVAELVAAVRLRVAVDSDRCRFDIVRCPAGDQPGRWAADDCLADWRLLSDRRLPASGTGLSAAQPEEEHPQADLAGLTPTGNRIRGVWRAQATRPGWWRRP